MDQAVSTDESSGNRTLQKQADETGGVLNKKEIKELRRLLDMSKKQKTGTIFYQTLPEAMRKHAEFLIESAEIRINNQKELFTV